MEALNKTGQREPCQCELCKMQRDIFSGPLTGKQKRVFVRMWNRMEDAETDLNIMRLQSERDGRIFFHGKAWIPLGDCAGKAHRPGRSERDNLLPEGNVEDLGGASCTGASLLGRSSVAGKKSEKVALAAARNVPRSHPKRGGAMPKKVEEALEKKAKEKGLTGEAKDRYVYGTMQKKGLMKGGKKK